MDLSFKFILVPLLTALTAILANGAMAVFHDGIRPILPELVEGRMKRRDAAAIAFGLSVGFIASVGISFTLSTGLLNPWLLFLPTDILGVMATKKRYAGILGAAWGFLIVTSLSAVNAVLTSMPIDLIAALGNLSKPVVTCFALFPVLAIVYQFGIRKGVFSAFFVLLVRVLINKYTALYAESFEIFVGMILLIAFAIKNDLEESTVEDDSMTSVFAERTKRIRNNLPWLAATGALIALIANMRLFAGSEVSIYTLAEAYKAADPAVADGLITQAAIAEFMRGLGFIPLIVTTALATGVYGVAGLTFVYVIGYIAPNPVLAVIGGALVISLEILLLSKIGNFLEKFPTVRASSDSIRSGITTSIEFALLIGSVFAIDAMGGVTGLTIGALVYLINEAVGRPIMKLAIGPVIAIGTGLILNILYMLNLFTI